MLNSIQLKYTIEGDGKIPVPQEQVLHLSPEAKPKELGLPEGIWNLVDSLNDILVL